MNYRPTLLAAGFFGTTGVALGAFGAHGLRDMLLERGTAVAWETAARYQILHAVALLAAGVALKSFGGPFQRRIGWAALCWCAGIVVFCGSLYGVASGARWLGPVTPFGGLALLAGWICLCAAAWAKEE